jgi:diaminopimelate epimerase
MLKKIKFTKMNGAGNDFVVIDNRLSVVGGQLSMEQIRTLSSRDNAVTKGCDQLLILEKSEKADVFMRIYNADGGQVDACGNATRCIADMLYKELGRLPVTIETNVAILSGTSKNAESHILVDMGAPKFEWQDIPLAMPIEEATKKIKEKFGLENPIFVNMGNPHVVFFISFDPMNEGIYETELNKLKEIENIGKSLELYRDVFPERVNVSFAILSKNNGDKEFSYNISAIVWERGAGLTKACGTGACAMLAAANKLSNKIKNSRVRFENSDKQVIVELEKNGHILLGGAVEIEFEGVAEI